jgi:hypothetical protein
MRMLRPLVLLALSLAASGLPAVAEESVLENEDVSNVVEVRDIYERTGEVIGIVVNRAPVPIRNLRLLVQYEWRWTDEKHPGSDPPGWTGIHVIPETIAPGATASFTVRPPNPPDTRPDGTYVVNVKVMGFTKVVTTTQP